MSKIIDSYKSRGLINYLYDFRTGSIKDQSGNGSDLTVAGSGIKFVNNRFGKAVLNRLNGYFTSAHKTSQQINGAMTMIWFGKIQDNTKTQVYIAKQGAGAQYYQMFSTPSLFGISDGSANSTVTTDINGANFLAVTCSGLGTAPKFFKDGNFIGDGSNPMSIQPTTEPLCIGFYNIYYNVNQTSLVAVFPQALTDEEVVKIYAELMTERGATRVPTRGFVYNPPAVESNCVLALDMTTKTGDGKIPDLSGGGNNMGIISLVSESGAYDKALRGDGVKSYGIVSKNARINLTTNMSFSFLFKRGAAGVTEVLFDKGTNGYAAYFSGDKLNFGKSGVAAKADTTTTITDKIWHHAVITTNGTDSTKIYIDNIDVTNQLAVDAIADSNLDLILFRGNSPATNYSSCAIADFRMYNTIISDVQRTALYNKFASIVNYRDITKDTPVTLLANGVAPLPYTDLLITSNTASIVESNNKKWLTTSTSTSFVTPAKKVYGTWVFNAAHGAGGFCLVYFGTQTPSPSDIAAYNINMYSDNKLYLQYGGGSFVSTAIFLPNVEYRICITRDYNGWFTIYHKELNGGTWQKTPAGAGTNPQQLSTIKTGNFFQGSLSVTGSKIGDLAFYEGVIDPTIINL